MEDSGFDFSTVLPRVDLWTYITKLFPYLLSVILAFEGLCGKESTQPVRQVLYKQENCQEKSHVFVASFKKKIIKKKFRLIFP